MCALSWGPNSIAFRQTYIYLFYNYTDYTINKIHRNKPGKFWLPTNIDPHKWKWFNNISERRVRLNQIKSNINKSVFVIKMYKCEFAPPTSLMRNVEFNFVFFFQYFCYSFCEAEKRALWHVNVYFLFSNTTANWLNFCRKSHGYRSARLFHIA